MSLSDKKFEYWSHQLLDLGKRNKMINYRETKRTTIKLTEPSYADLFNRLAINEETLTFQRPVDRDTDLRVFSVLSLLEALSAPLTVTVGDIKTEGNIQERQNTLQNMRAKSRLALEEQGTNILYISFGFIEWKDGKGAAAQILKSPLILVPAVLSLDALHSPYTLKKHEDDIVVNPTLEYYLKTEYGIELPQFDADKETPDDYFLKLEEIADQRGWRIIREVSLGLLSFLKISMYNDLQINKQRIMESPIIRAMAGDISEVNDIPQNPGAFELDSISTQDCFQVMSADSSQQDAILCSKNNISFVMQGPPGTGKSQTITNIIAEALADGKKVLFVSEKMAALQVVYRRLQEAHLGDFCLPLHSYKANKKETLEQIGANLKLKQTRVRDAAIGNLEELLAIRQELNGYAEELHARNPELNISCYEAYSKLDAVGSAPYPGFALDDPIKTTQAQLQMYLNTLQVYSLSLQALNYFIHNNPWDGFTPRTCSREYIEQMSAALQFLTDSFGSLTDTLETISEAPGSDKVIAYASLPELCDMLTGICGLPQIPAGWIGGFDFSQGIEAAENAGKAYSRMFSLRKAISNVFIKAIRDYSSDDWRDSLLLKAGAVAALPLIDESDPFYYINDAASLKAVFTGIQSALNEANNAFRMINDELGTDFPVSVFSHQLIGSLFGAIRTNAILNRNWFYGDISYIKRLAVHASGISAAIIKAKIVLLQNWEPELLSLDYEPVLLRYKTEYTNVLKIFNPQYTRDRKLIRTLGKTVIKNLSDDAVVGMLTILKEFHDNVDWLMEMSDELEVILGGYYSGVDTDWTEVIRAIDIAEKIKNLQLREFPAKLIDLLSVDHNAVITRLDNRLSVITAAFAKLRAVKNTVKININIDAADFDFTGISAVTSDYLSGLEAVLKQIELIKPYLIKTGERIEVVCRTVGFIDECNELQNRLAEAEADYSEQFGFLFKGESTDWNNICNLLRQFSELKKSDLFAHLVPLVNISDVRKQELNKVALKIKEIVSNNCSQLDWFKSQFEDNSILQSITTVLLKEKLTDCRQNIDKLEKWIDYRESRAICEEAGLGDFIEKFEDTCLYENIESVFLKGFYIMWLGAVWGTSTSVRRFRRNIQDERVKKFTELDELQLAIAQMRIREKLIENLPSGHQLLRATDEVAILNHELGKKRNIMPLRKLFRMIPNLLLRLKPCLMMSPLSVSYFLETEAYHFDLVIFDEASQIFPEDAIGAIFRGSQVIIAGDSKQLPPTNFFASSTNNFDGDYDTGNDDEYSDIISDSILEESASVLPNRTLLWHYRSRHENLIAFSNREIYNNNLITFPGCSDNLPDMGVEYIYVENGRYDRRGKKNNIEEAKKCVRLVFEHIEKYPDRSLGIIAFSESQQTTIENAIIDYRERHPEYEWFFNEGRDEPFFVKNLENVQGDERDTIIFSICYGKDEKGVMYMNFGPVGHNGGERRLNVAVTRAKCNVKLVGSILPSDIDLNRAKSEGARMLRAYIEYARNGTSALKPVDRVEAIDSGDDFCNIVADFLEQHGYKIKRQVGCSDYKIDIAVVNPYSSGDYIAGIECDGLSYISAKTARDRDHLRSDILRGMGWNLYRVWSTEWVRNPNAEGEALLGFLNSVCNTCGKAECNMSQSGTRGSGLSIKGIATETDVRHRPGSDDNPYGFTRYREADIQTADGSFSYEDAAKIGEIILSIVSVEQPVHLELLYRKMGRLFTAGKATEKVKKTIDGVIAKTLNERVAVDSDRFLRLLPLTPITTRTPDGSDTPRPLEYTHTEEVAEAMRRIIGASFGITEEELAVECAQVFGFERIGPKIRMKIEAAKKFLTDNEIIRIIDGKMQLTGELE